MNHEELLTIIAQIRSEKGERFTIPENIQEVINKIKLNGKAGTNDNDEIYTIDVLKRAFELLAENIQSIITFPSNANDVNVILEYATYNGWFIIPHDRPVTWYTVVIPFSSACQVDEKVLEAIVKLAYAANNEYWT